MSRGRQDSLGTRAPLAGIPLPASSDRREWLRACFRLALLAGFGFGAFLLERRNRNGHTPICHGRCGECRLLSYCPSSPKPPEVTAAPPADGKGASR